MMRPIGIFGGTFDPVHHGHLRLAVEMREALGLAEVRLIPCGLPPHRQAPVAGEAQRLAMLRLAVADEPGLVVDERELKRPGPSYTVDTLAALRDELGETPLCLLLGLDAFLGLESWHRWRRLTDLAHIVVTHRPGWTLENATAAATDEVLGLLRERRLQDADELAQRPAGGIWLQPVSQLQISSTRLRELVAEHRSVRYLLPEGVRRYIESENLYTS